MPKPQFDFRDDEVQERILRNALQSMFFNYIQQTAETGEYLSMQEQLDEMKSLDCVLNILTKKPLHAIMQDQNSYVQTRIILQMVDQVSERLKNLKNLKNEYAMPSFGEIVLASAISASKLTLGRGFDAHSFFSARTQ